MLGLDNCLLEEEKSFLLSRSPTTNDVALPVDPMSFAVDVDLVAAVVRQHNFITDLENGLVEIAAPVSGPTSNGNHLAGVSFGLVLWQHDAALGLCFGLDLFDENAVKHGL